MEIWRIGVRPQALVRAEAVSAGGSGLEGPCTIRATKLLRLSESWHVA
jgi:hypothetical protein